MNKTINMNLGGLIFHIDENAYALLKNYLEAVSNSLNEDVEGKTEIIADIEARISELLRKIATENADRIAYKYTFTDNTLLLDGYFLSGLENTHKDEQVSVQVAVPEGVVVYFGNSTRSFLYDIDNVQNIDDNDMVNRHFLMTSKGLECTDCDEKVY